MVGKPESGFRGLLLTVTESSNVELRAWLRGEHQCFPQGDEWQHVEAWWAVTNKSSVSMGIVTEECQLMCTINHQLQVQQSVPEFELLAYGPSRWIAKRLPDFCNITYRDASNVQHFNFSVCDIALFDKNTALGMNTASTTASSSWLSLPLFVSTTSLLLAALVVAVMLIVYLKRHQHILPDPRRFEFQSGHHDDHPHLDQERDSNESWVPTCLAPIAQVHPSVTEPRKNENLATEYNESPLYDDVAAYQGTSHGRNESSVYENVAVYQVASHGRNESPVYDNVAVYQCTSQERNESPVYDNVAVYIINESPVNDYLEYY
ncbi:uncharacterized protein LOC123516134 [Portunus trituberculatus]|uniref:uncharacterized protein LOC123516134 n=1 Tax=Portunus trituberculatus TaxID=210409 RepID=UPI001E1D0A02|nr:uncharacterized protein LOC123516134 [Portunus trituberculatus]